MNGKNILVLTPTPSHPQDAGNRKRIYALTKYLQDLGAKIYFVYCPREWDREIPHNSYNGMNQCWDYFFLAYPVQRAVHQTDDEYFEIDAWWDVGIEYTINWIELSVDIDMVLCNYVFYSKVLELFDENVVKVIDTHDIVSNRNYLLEKKLGYRDFFFTSPESERKALDRAHVVLSIKEDESTWFKCLASTPVLTIGHLEPTPPNITQKKIDYGKIKLGFIGSANPINCKNLESFLDEYLTIQDKYAERFSFVVGGKVCQVLDSRFSDRVRVLGMVDDVSQFYQEVDIVVLPFEFSTGLKIKTVEALAWDKPCIGTVNAFEGLGSSCKYHSFRNIGDLARAIEDLALDPRSVIKQLKQDSQLVRTTYASKVQKSIKKLYNVNWPSVKELQLNSDKQQTNSLEPATAKIYNFNLITNIDFWNSHSNEALWIKFWLNNAQKLGNVNVYRTNSFKNLKADKEILYRQGLINNVHHRELYQIIDLFKIAPDRDRIFINLVDFNSIVYNHSCLTELDKIQLANNHFLWYFFGCLKIEDDKLLEEYAAKIQTSDRHKTSYLWDFNRTPNLATNGIQHEFSQHPIAFCSDPPKSINLETVVIGTSCVQENSIEELNKLVVCCRDFLPNNFELVILSDLESVNKLYTNVHSLGMCEKIIKTIDLFVCIEDPRAISFLIYLCICRSILINYKPKNFPNLDIPEESIEPIDSFTSIPSSYKSYLQSVVFHLQEATPNMQHQNWNKFVEYCLSLVPSLSSKPSENLQQLTNKI